VTQREAFAGRDRLRHGRRDARRCRSGGWPQPLNGGPTSILLAALGDCSDGHPDVAVLACVRLRGLAPSTVEQGAGRGHTGRRWGGLGAADACQRADGQRGLCPRQRSNICCSLGHLGGFALLQLRAAYRRPGSGARAVR